MSENVYGLRTVQDGTGDVACRVLSSLVWTADLDIQITSVDIRQY